MVYLQNFSQPCSSLRTLGVHEGEITVGTGKLQMRATCKYGMVPVGKGMGLQGEEPARQGGSPIPFSNLVADVLAVRFSPEIKQLNSLTHTEELILFLFLVTVDAVPLSSAFSVSCNSPSFYPFRCCIPLLATAGALQLKFP